MSLLMARLWLDLAPAAFAYLLGSIPFGVLWSRLLAGRDPRQQGSRNIGFTNVLRVVGRLPAALTLLSDIGKGYMAVALASFMNQGTEPLALLLVVAGHLFSVFLRFRGGKGVATALGGLVALDPRIAVVCLGIWIVVFALRRTVSLASIAASLVLPVAVWIFLPSGAAVGSGILLSLLVILRHRENIVRLMQGVEPRVGMR